MKTRNNTVYAIIATVSLALWSIGCGSSSDDQNKNPAGAVGGTTIYGGGIVQNTQTGATTISFNGTNVYDSGSYLYGTNYLSNPQGSPLIGENSLSIGNPTLPVGQSGTIVANSNYFPGTQLQLFRNQGGAAHYANISAVLNLSPSVASAYGQLTNLRYVYFYFQPSGNSGYFQIALCCTNRNTWLYVQ